jgi:hypothetical protein
MTEAEWLACADPTVMLEFLRGKVSDRKLRLFAAAGFRHLTFLLPGGRQLQALELLEQIADGTVTENVRRKVISFVHQAFPPANVSYHTVGNDPYYVDLMLYRAVVSSNAAGHAAQAVEGLTEKAEERRFQSCLLRDIVANPFAAPRPIQAAWLRWNDSTVLRIATGIYEERAFERLPVLGDALLDSGCDDEAMLEHCRQQESVHARGCWVIDLLLGKS